MKRLIASTLLLAPMLALAAPAAPKPSGVQVASKAPAKKAAPKKAPPKKNRQVAKSAAAATALAGAGVGGAALAAHAGTPAPLDAKTLALADLVHTGQIGCELGKRVTVTRDEAYPGYFNVAGNGFNFHMSPVPTTTGTHASVSRRTPSGAVRLEDTRAGAVWLQIANKSMLMNQKAGQRLADECMSPAQLQVAEAIKKNPLPNLLEGPAGK